MDTLFLVFIILGNKDLTTRRVGIDGKRRAELSGADISDELLAYYMGMDVNYSPYFLP